MLPFSSEGLDVIIFGWTRKSSKHFTFLFEFSKAKFTLTPLRGKPSTSIPGSSESHWQMAVGNPGFMGWGRRSWEGWVGIASCSVTHSSACQERGASHARNTDFWEAIQVSHSSLLFGGNISSFYRGSILFSYQFFNKDILE